MIGYLYIAGCVLFTVYGQLILKWRMNLQETLPETTTEKIIHLIKLVIFDPFILSGFVAAFIASLFWMAAMTKFSLSFAYPFMSSAFIIVMFLSALLFGEVLNTHKLIGTACIVVGIVVLSQGYKA
ncbi:EamA family transporter [Colwellia sp. 1_MG-2023]|uniref:EamA family transporter n=1 Tax=Colwellia sp. 1_MG-2023 TaxID=3062649 RepID=UPI0026E12336|nr:EamA family transporter [Colwellia sp. 1_MG-2023]MDO6444988.1 EamA family transporter [Colwellia sp. 1_MG-2023]